MLSSIIFCLFCVIKTIFNCVCCGCPSSQAEKTQFKQFACDSCDLHRKCCQVSAHYIACVQRLTVRLCVDIRVLRVVLFGRRRSARHHCVECTLDSVHGVVSHLLSHSRSTFVCFFFIYIYFYKFLI